MTTSYTEMPDFLVRHPPQPQLTKPLVFTFTMLNTYLICPHQMYRRYVKKDLKFVETPEMKWGNEVHTAFEHRMGGKPLPENMRQWEPLAAPIAALQPLAEVKLGITAQGNRTGFWDQNVFFRGKADVIAIKGSAAFLPDWKSGKPREDPFELATNAMLVKASNPGVTKIGGAYVWLKENRMGPKHDVSDTKSTWAKVNNLIEEIQECQHSDPTYSWTKKKGPLCAWCAVFDCENNSNPKKL